MMLKNKMQNNGIALIRRIAFCDFCDFCVTKKTTERFVFFVSLDVEKEI